MQGGRLLDQFWRQTSSMQNTDKQHDRVAVRLLRYVCKARAWGLLVTPVSPLLASVTVCLALAAAGAAAAAAGCPQGAVPRLCI
jgi:hypothetical protein